MEESTIALLILAATIVLFATELIPIPVTAVSAALAMGIFGVIPFSSAFSGFANDITIMIIGSMIVGEALFETGVAEQLGNIILRAVGKSERAFLLACVATSAVLSAFLSNTAVVAMMLPVVAATAAKSSGLIEKKDIYMAVGFAANIGGGMTLVGSTPNVIGQGLLEEAGLETMTFFDLTLGAIPRFIFILLFYAFIGYPLQKKIFSFADHQTEEMEIREIPEKKRANPHKMFLSIGIMILTVIGFITGIWTVGTVALLAGLACIWTGCISVRQVFARLDWTTVWVMAGSFGFAAGIDESGAGKLIADTVIGWFGGSVSMMTLLILFTLLATLMGNFMSSSASTAILGPIAIFICKAMGYPSKPVIMVIIWALNLAFLTPVATPPVTMTLQGGYRVLDYTKIGAPLLLGCLILTIAFYPLIFQL